jgi:cyclophilin family peptidyl-prolyl cis-trans isomerase
MKINYLRISFILLLPLLIVLLAGCGNENSSKELGEVNNINKKEMVTNLGKIKVQLYKDKAPLTVENFVQLAKEGKYDNVPFHRVIKDFMVQGGDFMNKNGTGGHAAKFHEGLGVSDVKETWLVPDEFHEDLKHVYGAISMANRGPDTGGSQFFIVNKKDGTDWLDGKHSVFGKVIEGMDVVEKISDVEVDGNDAPIDPVQIKKITIDESGENPVAEIEI